MPFPSRRPLLGLLLALTLPLPALAAQWEPALQAIEALLARHSHDPQALQGERFERLRAELRQLGRSTPEPAAFIEGFNLTMSGGPVVTFVNVPFPSLRYKFSFWPLSLVTKISTSPSRS